MLRSKEDIQKFADDFKTLDSIYHRHDVRSDTMLYVDNSYGELIPFFNVKSRKIMYTNVSNRDVLKEGLLKSKILNSKVREIDLNDEEQLQLRYGIVFVNCSERLVKTCADRVQLNGILITTSKFDMNDESSITRFSKLCAMDGFHVYRRVDCAFRVKSGNLFESFIPMENKIKYKCTSDVDISLRAFRLDRNKIRLCGLVLDNTHVSCEVEVEVYSLDASQVCKFTHELSEPMITQRDYEVPFEVCAKGTDHAQDHAQKIPKVICQTLNENMTSSMHFKTILNIQMLNPEYSYEFYNNQERRRFIAEFYNSEVLDTYDGLVSGAFKADLFRYCWLYKQGGVYVDCKMIQRVPFSAIIDPGDVFFLCEDRIPNAYQNCLIGAQGQQKDILRCVIECVKRFKAKIHHKVSFGSLYHTGPYLFHSCMKHHATKAAFRGPFRDLTYSRTGIYCQKTGELLFNVWFKDYYQNYRKIHGRKIWSQDWAEGNIYYSDKFDIENTDQYSIRIHPSELKSISNVEDIRFVYEEGGYVFNNLRDDLRCQLFDENEHIDQTIIVGKK